MRFRSEKAFTLIEIILSVAISAVLLTGVISLLFVFGHQSLPISPTHTSALGQNTFHTVPSSRSFNAATRLMDRFQAHVSDAAAVFVLGGYREQAVDDPMAGANAPIALGYVFPAVGGLAAGEVDISALSIPQTAIDFRAVLNARSGAQFEPSWDASDFSVVTLNGLRTVSSVTQVRRFVAGDYACYEVLLDTDLAAARQEGVNRFVYRMSLPLGEDTNWQLPVGARHYWFRHDPDWSRREEGPALVVFPDPLLMAGVQPNGDTQPFSRFNFFLKTTN